MFNSSNIKEKLSFVFFFLFIILFVSNADTPTSIYTPKSSLVSDTYITDEMSQNDIDYYNQSCQQNYPDADSLNTATRTYNCHAYAWHMSEGGNTVWLGYSSSTAEDVYWTDYSYIEVASQANGQKVSYQGVNHSAITTSTSDWFISKWGVGPLMYHEDDDCPFSATGYKYYKFWNTPPTNLTITNNYSTGENPELSWTASEVADSYKIYRNVSSWEYIGSTGNTYMTDEEVEMASIGDSTKIQYKVTAVNDGGETDASNVATTWGYFPEVPKRGVEQIIANIPEEYGLQQNYPNPFNPVTTLKYQIPKDTHVKITVYNMQGKLIATLADVFHSAGYYTVSWNAQDHPSGVYVCRMVTKNFTSVKKLMLVK